ncbi:hypothetical protein HJG60_011714 [Phyllostomus discolor]|uniref:Uncharacterized protein n=1 Tax=Phyllostomus discolor TaxID=89673 RepID=A0A833ZVX6_9CHIR|nr:hypothetical protein HJG60_011714 [Phyllostomus discolor]
MSSSRASPQLMPLQHGKLLTASSSSNLSPPQCPLKFPLPVLSYLYGRAVSAPLCEITEFILSYSEPQHSCFLSPATSKRNASPSRGTVAHLWSGLETLQNIPRSLFFSDQGTPCTTMSRLFTCFFPLLTRFLRRGSRLCIVVTPHAGTEEVSQ